MGHETARSHSIHSSYSYATAQGGGGDRNRIGIHLTVEVQCVYIHGGDEDEK